MKSQHFKERNGRVALLLPEDVAGYERISGGDASRNRPQPTRLAAAYNQTTLLGLNPEKSYVLSDAPRDFSQTRINNLPEGVSVTASRVLQKMLPCFRLERRIFLTKSILLSQIHLARTGIILDGEEFTRGREVQPSNELRLPLWAFRRLRLMHIRRIKASVGTHSENGQFHCRTVLTSVLEFDIGLRDGFGRFRRP